MSENTNLRYGTFISYADINELLGKMLTYVDATYTNQEQRDAHKSIIKQTVRDWYYVSETSIPLILNEEYDQTGGRVNLSASEWNRSISNMPRTVE